MWEESHESTNLPSRVWGFYWGESGLKGLSLSADIVSGRGEQIPAEQAEVFIKLEFHATGSMATGTKRSRDIAEP
jgi:hypothetical protein